MEVFQWRLNVPGNYQGVVLASDESDAFRAVKSFADNEFNDNTEDIDLLWIGYNKAAEPDVYVLTNM